MTTYDLESIGKRLKGLREVLDIPLEEIAAVAETSVEHYLKIESGEADPSVYRLSRISKQYGIELDVLLFGEEPHMNGYFITRKGQGMTVDRGNDYSYESLASGFRDRKAECFMTTVDPLPGNRKYKKNTHDGQEFDYILEGTLEVTIGLKEMILKAGDSIYFDATRPHCFRAIGGPVKFLCAII